jgi:hypothetical protein
MHGGVGCRGLLAMKQANTIAHTTNTMPTGMGGNMTLCVIIIADGWYWIL